MRTKAAMLMALSLVAIGSTIVPPSAGAITANDGSWSVKCSFSHSAADDPIVRPGQPGVTHLHDFLGNRSTDANSTHATLAVGASTCPQGDRSAYWVPALYRNGVRLKPSRLQAYYIRPLSDMSRKVQTFPPGFRMIFGNAANSTVEGLHHHIRWACSDNTSYAKEPPATCSVQSIQVRFEFPSCWNGVVVPGNQIAADSLRHPAGDACPAGFDTLIPALRMNVHYQTGAVVTGNITLASGNVYSAHADFFNAWDEGELQTLIDRCLNAGKVCPSITGSTPAKAS